MVESQNQLGLKIEIERRVKVNYWVTENEKQQIQEEEVPLKGEEFNFGHIWEEMSMRG